MSKIFPDNSQTIGGTPLVKINHISDGNIYVKLENRNPAMSVKCRIGSSMVLAAEQDGSLKPGMTIVDPTSGNTGIALAFVAAARGYGCILTMPNTMSLERRMLMKALGAEIVLTDGAKGIPAAIQKAEDILASDPAKYWGPHQFENPANPAIHEQTTGPEIWEQMQGRIDYFVAGVGTGGTISGVARFLKEKDPNIRVIGIDPEGSIFYDYFHSGKIVESRRYLIEGLGDEFLIKCVEFDLIDDMDQVPDRESFYHARQLVKEEGIMGGGSSGSALWGVLKLARSLTKPARIVTLFPDSASRYLSTIFNDQWMKSNGLL